MMEGHNGCFKRRIVDWLDFRELKVFHDTNFVTKGLPCTRHSFGHCDSLERMVQRSESFKDNKRPIQRHRAITPNTFAQVDDLIRQG